MRPASENVRQESGEHGSGEVDDALRRVSMMKFVARFAVLFSCLVAFALVGPSGAPPPAPGAVRAAAVPSGFQETVVLAGLTNPTVVRFAGDGRVFVAEKSGLIKVFDGLLDTTPTVFADLRSNVHNFWDRGLLGMALHPNFPANPYVYVLYAYDHELGSQSAPPRWGDACPTPPGATTAGCVVSGRLSRLQAAGDTMTGSEQVLIEDWCQQYPSHSTGAVEFGPDGALYASAGDGASFTFVDHGQAGTPLNPCGDPPGGVGATLSPPSAEGGALRSQDLRTPGDPVTLDGSIIRVDPVTGAGLPTNPLAADADPNARRIIAYGLRNPFRFTFRPGTSELWVGDVGWGDWEEINRVLIPDDAVVENFGWPCYEGNGGQSGFRDSYSICTNLPPNADTKPFHAYHHASKVVSGETCPTGSSSLAGLAFEFAPGGTNFPEAYQGALFFADYSRDCIWVMRKNGNPVPSPGSIDTFVAGAANPVNLEFGPGGDLFYVDFDGGTIRRIEAIPASQPPAIGTHYLSDLAWSSMTNGWGAVQKDQSINGSPLTLSGTIFPKGLGTHAVSESRYLLAGSCTRFKASVGVDDATGANGSVVFQVYADATKIYDSGIMLGTTATKTVDVSVAGASQLRLMVTNGGDNIDSDHADWALARIECGGSAPPPTITGNTPAGGATAVALDARPTATFSEAMDPASLTTNTFTLVRQGTTIPLPASISYNAATVSAVLTPSSTLEPTTTYAATVKGGSNGAKNLAGVAVAADFSWTFTTGSQQSGATFLSDLQWTAMTNGWGAVQKDQSTSGLPLTLNGTTYAKGLGAHAASEVRYSLGGSCSRFKADVGIDDHAGANGSAVFQVYADLIKVYESGLMLGTTATATVDVSIAGASELRLVVTEGGDGIDWDHVDWALARVECGADTNAPTVTGNAPALGATNVALDVRPAATFSEAMDSATLTANSFRLVEQGTTTPLSASVSYDGPSRTATLDPSADLPANTTYTATVKGGAGGARDLAGNPLATDFSWTFMTAAGANQSPTPVIDLPATNVAWKVGDVVSFSGQATDPEQGSLPASALTWRLLLQHCPSTCHSHVVQTWQGVASGSFAAPDHEYPSYLELELAATDSNGANAATYRRLDPMTVALTFQSVPPGLQLTFNGTSSPTPLVRTVIVGSANSVNAASPQVLAGTTWEFLSWSDGAAQARTVVAQTATTYTATYVIAPPRSTVLPAITGLARAGRTLTASTGTWSGSQPMAFAYQWLRCRTTAMASCTSIVGATANSYVATAADVGLRLRATVTATNGGGSSAATAIATPRVKAA